MDIIEQNIKSGITPLELVYAQVISTRSEKCVAYHSLLRINSLELGTLMPQQYEEITQRNIQSERLAAWAIDKLPEEITALENKGLNYDWVSVYVPVRMLNKKKLYNRLNKMIKSGKIKDSSKIALEFSSDILFCDKNTIEEFLIEIKSLDFVLILKDFGGEFCPLSRIYGLPFDIVILDGYVKNLVDDTKTQKVAQNIMNYAKDIEIRVIMSGVNSIGEISTAYNYGCTECIGDTYKKIEEIVS